jgi:hypothetical protein
MYLQNKYTNWYYSIINNAQLRILSNDVYTEKHHIIPKSLGGSNLKNNLVRLTAREHFICHLLLTKITFGEHRYKMLSAVTKFQQSRSFQYRTLNSWEYQKLRECAILARTGIPHTAEAKRKIKDKHHNVAGPNNPRARHIRAVSPNGEIYNLHGSLKRFCKEQELAYSSALRLLSVQDKWKRSFKGSTEGWSFVHLD